MILLVALAVISSSFAEDDLRQILKSPKASLELYSNFKAAEGLKYPSGEDRLRFRLFLKNAEFVADLNEYDETAIFRLNFFSSMTRDEKKQYLGLNITEREERSVYQAPTLSSPPTEKLWTNVGAVTEVKNQGSCGSCWTFGAVGGLETRYQQGSGKLRSFSEQEYLDCVYRGQRNGCEGGWPEQCYRYSKTNGGRLASTASYRYTGKSGECQKKYKADAMVAMKIKGDISVGKNEAANINALATGSLSVCFQVTGKFHQYAGGILRDNTCTGSVNHAVTAVGYTATFILVKNSWGPSWGDRGFVKFARHHDNCGLYRYSTYPKLVSTGHTDTSPSDAATTYNPNDGGNDNKPACRDNFDAMPCEKIWCTTKDWRDWAAKECARTCGTCDRDTCPSGTTRCPDGICRHVHMC